MHIALLDKRQRWPARFDSPPTTIAAQSIQTPPTRSKRAASRAAAREMLRQAGFGLGTDPRSPE